MKVNELQPKQGKVDIELKIVSKEEPRELEKFGKAGRVCNATGEDETGQVKVTLWNEQVDQVNVGDAVKITNGFVNEWQGEKQLTTGKFGQLEIGGASAAAPAQPQQEQAAPTPAPEPKPTVEEVQVDEEDII